MTRSKATPMIKQYLSIKDAYPDAILFYRMGDFYEMFFEDAEIASKVLEIALTSRNKNDESPVPMCGVPFRAAQAYIARLIEKGFKVAVCDQVEDPALAKGLVKREVVRVITPGMIVDNELLDAKTNNYLLSVTRYGSLFGMATMDISTGIFRVTEADDVRRVAEEIMRIEPREVLVPEFAETDPELSQLIQVIPDSAVTTLGDAIFGHARGRERLLRQFNTLTLEGFGCERLKVAVGAAGALLYYVQDTQKHSLDHLPGLETYDLYHHLMVDASSFKNLELFSNLQNGSTRGTLINILDRTVTAMGGRRLKQWIRYPLRDADLIRKRHDAVEESLGNIHHTRTMRESLKSIYDLERLGSKICMGQSNARDLVALKKSILALPDIWSALESFESELFHYPTPLDPLFDLASLIDDAIREDSPPTINEGGIIREGYNQELDELIRMSRDGKGWLAKLESDEREATGIHTLKVRYNKVFGYYIEIPKARSESVPAHYVRKQTLVNAERYITDELKNYETKVLGAEEERAKLENQLYLGVKEQTTKQHHDIQSLARYLGRLDCLTALADVADINRYKRPAINTDGIIEIADGRHPVVEKMITGERFVPNSIQMDNTENQVLIITGPNMAGKSTVLRQVALTVLMAQLGSFVPADRASLCIIDRIFTRVGALDNLSQGQSTFMVEMQETANILNHATQDSLVIMDEIGRGTSTYDGMSIAWAVAEHLHDIQGRGVKSLFATHYHELVELADSKERVKNFNIAVKEWNDEIIFLRKLVEGGTNRSYGIQVARLAGIPSAVIKRAKKILFDIENNHELFLGKETYQGLDQATDKSHHQLNLFKGAGNHVLEDLRRIDISKLTPIEAINRLHDLQERAKASH